MSLAQLGVRKVAVIGAGPVAAGIATMLDGTGVAVATIAPVLHNGACCAAQQYASLPDASDCLSQADWIIEASGADLAHKQALFRYLAVVRKASCLVSSDESVVPRSALVAGLGAGFDAVFAVTHFFLPIDRLPLLELICGDSMPDHNRSRFKRLCAGLPGRSVLECGDRAGFVANRIGLFWIAMAGSEALARGLTIGEADAIAYGAFGLPRSGIFGLADLIGFDLLSSLVQTLQHSLAADDALQAYRLQEQPGFCQVRAQTTDGAFYRKSSALSPREVFDTGSGAYRHVTDVDTQFAGTPLEQMCRRRDKYGAYTRDVLELLQGYVQAVCTEHGIALPQAESAMRLGYGWRSSPFNQWQNTMVSYVPDSLNL